MASTTTPTKACVPCRGRKTKCDAATIGVPCSGCANTPKAQPALRAPSLAWSRSPGGSSRHAPTPDSMDRHQSQTQLHYYHILKEAVNDGALDEQNDKTGTPFDSADDGHGTPPLDDIDKEYLNKKRVFDLPPRQCIVAFLTSYFTLLEPYSPIIDKVDFVYKFEAGTCSLFLLYAIMAIASLYVPHEIIEQCGFVDRSEAQAAFASRAALLCDFGVESDALPLIQGSILMTRVLPEQPTDKDSNYWLYNALRLATKLELYSHLPAMETLTTSAWSTERIPPEYRDIVPPTTGQQKALFIAICKLAEIYGVVVSKIVQDPCVDVASLMRRLNAWRTSLASQLLLGDQSANCSIHYLELLGTSYRYEATSCRLIQRQLRSVDAPKSNAAKQRLRSAMLELDGITARLLANGMMSELMIPMMTTVPALLALHLEAALDPSESELVRSMSRISISQAMLALYQLREIPAVKKAIPLFELILSRKKLYDGGRGGGPADDDDDAPQVCSPPESPWEEKEEEAGTVVPPPRLRPNAELADVPGEFFDSFVQDFLEYDAVGKWDFEQVDLLRLA
ncbi:Fungal transcriptional regulatory protein [Beauveria brongniartii RCEF 3172]|uniref:Fungal transcriptional regulatory protein n=1 Tax=Beauveria brongniartii RCEF 3172 TaxID=1081107 RepID=A0A162JH27_9HYPO|nr:Fungal transcriptional regulatory protein [Beauveria brongniartii RCEF 3172]